jgi:uncharacterized membrane protein
MNFALIFDKSIFVQLHLYFAIAAFFIGALQFGGRKGTPAHKILGRSWVMTMFIICLTSFWIKGLMPNSIFWGYSPIHLLSLFVLVQLCMGVYFARTGNISRHKKCMAYTYFGGLIIAGGFTFYPGRTLYEVFIVSSLHN